MTVRDPVTGDGLALRLLGPLRVERGGDHVDLPPSKKARAVLGYLATTAREHRRQQVSDLFWDVADDPRGGLRWCLSKLRPLLDEAGRTRIVANRECVRLDLSAADVDLHRARAAKAGLRALDTDSLVELAELFHGLIERTNALCATGGSRHESEYREIRRSSRA